MANRLDTFGVVTPRGRRTRRALVGSLAAVIAVAGALGVGMGLLSPAVAQPAATVTSLSVSPALPVLAPGMQQQFEAVATLAGGGTKNVTSSAKWVAPTPLVELLSKGHYRVPSGAALDSSVKLTATYGGSSASAKISVDKLTSLKVTAPSSLAPKAVTTPVATATFANGTTENASTNVYWSDSLFAGNPVQAGAYAVAAQELAAEGYLELGSTPGAAGPAKFPRGGGALEDALTYQTPQIEHRVLQEAPQLLAGATPAFITLGVGEPLELALDPTTEVTTVTGSEPGAGTLFAFWPAPGGTQVSASTQITVS